LLKLTEVRYGLRITLMVREQHLPLASQPIKLLIINHSCFSLFLFFLADTSRSLHIFRTVEGQEEKNSIFPHDDLEKRTHGHVNVKYTSNIMHFVRRNIVIWKRTQMSTI
jgi:hypothetical protein